MSVSRRVGALAALVLVVPALFCVAIGYYAIAAVITLLASVVILATRRHPR